MTHSPTPLMLSIRNAVIASGIRRTKLYELIGRGLIRAVKADGKTLIEVQSVRDYLDRLPTVPIKPTPLKRNKRKISDPAADRSTPA